MSKRERDPICDVCGHCHVQGVKCKICGHVGKYIGEARQSRAPRWLCRPVRPAASLWCHYSCARARAACSARRAQPAKQRRDPTGATGPAARAEPHAADD
eukprot:4549929-Prymnesium_polylepis.1